jgi:hypothetical protein
VVGASADHMTGVGRQVVIAQRGGGRRIRELHCPCCDLTHRFASDRAEPITPLLGSGAVLRNRGGCVERLKKGLSRVDVGHSFLKTV